MSVSPVDQAVAQGSGVRLAPEPGAGSEISGYIEPLSADDAFKVFGVELNSPARLYVEISDAASFPPQAEVSFSGRRYAVKGEPVILSAGLGVDHAVIYLEGLQYGS